MYVLVKALAEGFGVIAKPEPKADFDIPPEAMLAMQASAISAISTKAGPRLPVIKGRDKGLPKTPPTFDLDELRRRNADVSRRRAQIKAVKSV